MFMKFGKHKNQPVDKLPTEYIEWFCGNVSGCDDIKREMQTVLLARWGGMKPPEKPQKPPESRPTPNERQPLLIAPELPPLRILEPWDGVSAPF